MQKTDENEGLGHLDFCILILPDIQPIKSPLTSTLFCVYLKQQGLIVTLYTIYL
jgi:hypothetical protein